MSILLDSFVKRSRSAWIVAGSIFLFAIIALTISGCGLFGDGGNGKVHFKLLTSDNPDKPNINVPEETKRFLVEIIKESKSTSSDEPSEDSDSDSESVAEKGAPVKSFFVAKDDSSEASDGDDTEESGDDTEESGDDTEDGESTYVETTCTVYPASYSKSVENSGDGLDVTIDDIPAGSWILRVSALNSSDEVLAYVQKSVVVNDGNTVDISDFLNPGPAPEGYIYMASPTGNCVVRLSLYSEELQNLYTASFCPAVLFTQMGKLEGRLGSPLYALTGADKLLQIDVGYNDTESTTVDYYIPSNSTSVASQDMAVISYYSSNEVRFYDFTKMDYVQTLNTGTGPTEFSNVNNGKVWVTNEKSKDISKINIQGKCLEGSNISTGTVVKKLAINDDATRLWTISREPQPCVYVITPAGKLVQNYTEQIVNPSDIIIVGKKVCVSESSRGELVVYVDSDEYDELQRVVINEGVADHIISDGHRVYVLTNKKSLAVVDLTTLAYNRTIPVSGDCCSMTWLH